MFTLFVILHLMVGLILILVVLLQSGKAGDLASTFGGAGTQTAFGARGATTFLTKITTICAVTFMLTSLGLSIMYSEAVGTVMEGYPYEEVPATAPGFTPPGPEQPAEPQPPGEPAPAEPAP